MSHHILKSIILEMFEKRLQESYNDNLVESIFDEVSPETWGEIMETILNELSPATLKRYKKAAKADISDTKRFMAGSKRTMKNHRHKPASVKAYNDAMSDASMSIAKRTQGINRADKRLNK